MFLTKLKATRWFLSFIEKCNSKPQKWKRKDSQHLIRRLKYKEITGEHAESQHWHWGSNCPLDPGGRDWLNHRLLVHGYEGPNPWGDWSVCQGPKSWPQGKPSQGCGHPWALGGQPYDGKSWSPSQWTRETHITVLHACVRMAEQQDWQLLHFPSNMLPRIIRKYLDAVLNFMATHLSLCMKWMRNGG